MKYFILGILVFSVSVAQSQEITNPSEPPPQPVQVAAPPAPEKPAESPVFFGGDVYIALENWSRVGAADDSKMAFGFGFDFGVGFRLDNMKVLVGPHLGVHRWSADYSKKSQSATESIYVEMADTGVGLKTDFDDMYILMGGGSSTISSGMIVQGKDIKYSYDGDKYSYTTVGVGMTFDHVMMGLSTVNYSGYAKYCDRIEFLIGYGF